MESSPTLWPRLGAGVVLCPGAGGRLVSDRAAVRGGVLPIIPLSLLSEGGFLRNASRTISCVVVRRYLRHFRPGSPRALVGGHSLRPGVPVVGHSQESTGRCPHRPRSH